MFVHGGEGSFDSANHVRFQTADDIGTPDADVYQANDSHTFNSSWMGAESSTDQLGGVAMDGVCLGDTLGERLSPGVNVRLYAAKR